MPNPKLLRHAGLPEAFLRRLVLACRVASARQLTLRCEPWDGTRCDLAVLSVADAYGQRVADLARRRGTPLLGVHAPGQTGDMEAFPLQLSEEAATGEILDALLECVAAGTRTSSAGTLRATPAASEPPAAQDHAHDSLLGALAALDSSSTGWLHAQCSGIEVFIDRDGGRVCAESADMLKIAAPRGGREGWTAVPHPALQTGAPRRLASSALDSFLLTAALAARSTLPALPPPVLPTAAMARPGRNA